MTDTIEQMLAQAFELIEDEDLAGAQRILKPLIEADRNNADVWWLYAHAISDPETAHIALQNVLRIDKDYPEAQSLLNTLEASLPSSSIGEKTQEAPFSLPEMPATLPGFGGSEEDDLEDIEPEEDRRRTILISLAIMVIIFVVVVFMLLQNSTNRNGTPTETPTEQIQNTSVPVQQIGEYAILHQALSTFDVPDQGIFIQNTSVGNTLVVEVCEDDRRQARQTLPLVLDILANQSAAIEDGIDAIATRIQSCGTGEAWMFVGVPLQTAVDYTNGTIESADFQAAWKPVE
ncbi:MAG: hypothetical protein H6672_10135 [Anaerolineaceae bacterium]|nr:hypothetical protein [Anaerolineaceae bacterium]